MKQTVASSGGVCCKILFGCHIFVFTLCFFKVFSWVRWKACLNCLIQLWIYFITMLTFFSVWLTKKTKYNAKPWTLSLVQYHQHPHDLIFLPRNWYALPKMKHYRSVGSEAYCWCQMPCDMFPLFHEILARLILFVPLDTCSIFSLQLYAPGGWPLCTSPRRSFVLQWRLENKEHWQKLQEGGE